eukprot:CAMPEP_0179904730 /NCGR_PEP_ID=MMETSP0982-20121206/42120_1 /TAXON_ID=483367 /ORGANISM="non described non described, Strain CCMP 2436" /LENGTH=57 /DNA_ID=CAMNT_0021804697 /DNA_START=26 /DNA_END=196 /DNA_ORIENTATION=-
MGVGVGSGLGLEAMDIWRAFGWWDLPKTAAPPRPEQSPPPTPQRPGDQTIIIKQIYH